MATLLPTMAIMTGGFLKLIMPEILYGKNLTEEVDMTNAVMRPKILMAPTLHSGV